MRGSDTTTAVPNRLRLQVAGTVVKTVRSHGATIRIGCAGLASTNACSALRPLALAAPCGAIVRSVVAGPDRTAVLQAATDTPGDSAGT